MAIWFLVSGVNVLNVLIRVCLLHRYGYVCVWGNKACVLIGILIISLKCV